MAMSDIATTWVDTLMARGVTLKAKGKRLEMVPGNAYKALSDDELLTLRHHKAAIVAIVNERYDGIASGITPSDTRGVEISLTVVKENRAPVEAARCKWCNRSPCIGPEHADFALLHPHHRPPPTYSLAELYRSGDGLLHPEAPFTPSAQPDNPTDVMMQQVGKPLPDWWWR